MDELLREFLTETSESIDIVDAELVRFEQDPNNAKILGNIFRLVHTIKGTCGFLNLPRLEALTHAAEALIGKLRDGLPVTSEALTLILATIDRIKVLLDELERSQAEPAGADRDLITAFDRMVQDNALVGDAGQPMQQVPPRAEQAENKSTEAENTALADIGPSVDTSSREDDHREGAIASQSIRVAVDTLEHLMTTVSELVLTRNQLLDIARRHEESEFKAPLQRLASVTAELQEGVMKTRMQPIGNAWQKLPRIVRDLSTELGKTIEFEMVGAETELDRQVLDLIKDPLTHMVRNSADHGLEMPAARRAAGKPEKGTVRLSAWHEGGHIIIDVADDGRGLDTERIRDAVLTKGLASPAELDKMTEAQ